MKTFNKAILDNPDTPLVIVMRTDIVLGGYIEAIFYADETDTGVNEYIFRIKEILSTQTGEFRPETSIDPNL